ncbi:hypothetical protein Xen7305DRAFT_00040980 [Xenococcus sp. PCC 7305]|uniref:DUF924 family protein n=1 Tax=Xenococcus sp. PCC 7305 TaxID=102125 RepID=UPI0002AC7EB4|nr:DUF924 family protein [Xenococcus sp. PCC 7305]ELS04367.1 hypothetical protein Xen7305DRAFT_00040980 [Xenococcus sp. PCC 7305]
MNYKTILTFWFGKQEANDYGRPRKFWFIKDPNCDRQIKEFFEPVYLLAKAGDLDYWQENPFSCLALIIVLDQFPRNIYRGQPQAFATDSQALAFAQYAIEKGYDRVLLPVQRWFIYLPYEHSENLANQYLAVQLFSTLIDDPDSQSSIEYAKRHLKVIQDFGRFPHRNQILGRESTPEEMAFLEKPGSGF